MRLPQHLVENLWFLHPSAEAFHDAFPEISPEEFALAMDLAGKGLPPATSLETISVLFGYNPGIVRALMVNTAHYYRFFKIRSGKKYRDISSPKVSLKLIQTWAGFHLSRIALPPHVYGFVPGRSHVDAVEQHIGAEWAYSVDILDFFGTTPSINVRDTLVHLGYSEDAANTLTSLATLNGFLPQGSPASPALSNLCFRDVDTRLSQLADEYGCNLTRFADDISFSGSDKMPEVLPARINQIFAITPWNLHPAKVAKQPLKGRIKIHGLLVKNNSIALTKGYRNKIRAYRHLWLNGKIRPSDIKKIRGHLNFAKQVELRENCHAHFNWDDFDFDEKRASSAHRNFLLSYLRKVIRI